jgi:hypothetical protein
MTAIGNHRIGPVAAGSLATGLVVGLLLVAAPFIAAEESQLTGALLCGFALGWAMLAVLSVRFTAQPQRWAAAPALFLGAGGLALVVFGSRVHGLLEWVWPPALLVLVVWMLVRARRQLRSRTRRCCSSPCSRSWLWPRLAAGMRQWQKRWMKTSPCRGN